MTKPLRLRDAAGGNRKGKLTDEVDELVLADCDVWGQKKKPQKIDVRPKFDF